MIRTASILALAALAACTTTEGVRTNEPLYAGNTTLPRDQVAGCIALAWGQTKNFHTRTEQAGDRSDVILSGSSVAGIDMVASVYQDGRVEMHRRPAAWGNLDDQRRDDVVRCAAG